MMKELQCRDCPKRFIVLEESNRTRCARCERVRTVKRHRAKMSKAWHEKKSGKAIGHLDAMWSRVISLAELQGRGVEKEPCS